MPKLSDIKIDTSLFRGRGIRPWNDPSVIKPPKKDIVSNTLAKHEQNMSKALAKHEQSVIHKKECVSKALAEPLATQLENSEQSVSKALAISKKTKENEIIETLVGNEKNLLLFLFQKCQLIGSLESPAITTDELKKFLKIKAEHLRNLIYRLSNKNVIWICKIKNGRSGWRKFKFSKEVFQYLSLDQSVSNTLAKREQYVSKALAQPLAEPLASSTSSSGINYLNTTTSELENSKSNNLNDEWLKIDIESLSIIGFTKTHLMQIASQNILTAELVQVSIYAFAFDLQENDKAKNIKGDPINFFMGILRNGKPYAPPSNYESPQDKAMREYKEKMLKIEQGRAETEKEAVNLAFNDWFSQLTDEQKKEFLPDMLRRNTTSEKLGKNKMLEGSARSHFEAEIWPDIKNKIISSAALKTTEQAREVNEETQ